MTTSFANLSEITKHTIAAVEKQTKANLKVVQSCAYLLVASELFATAADTLSTDKPGMPVVELLLLSKRIASLVEDQFKPDIKADEVS